MKKVILVAGFVSSALGLAAGSYAAEVNWGRTLRFRRIISLEVAAALGRGYSFSAEAPEAILLPIPS